MIDTLIKILLGAMITLFGLMSAAAVGTGSKYNPTHDMPVFAVYVEVVPRMFVNQRCQEIMNSVTNKNEHEEDILLGCASWIVESQKCHIVVPEPVTKSMSCVENDPETNKCLAFDKPAENFVSQSMLATWGHEILHCTRGSFHD